MGGTVGGRTSPPLAFTMRKPSPTICCHLLSDLPNCYASTGSTWEQVALVHPVSKPQRQSTDHGPQWADTPSYQHRTPGTNNIGLESHQRAQLRQRRGRRSGGGGGGVGEGRGVGGGGGMRAEAEEMGRLRIKCRSRTCGVISTRTLPNLAQRAILWSRILDNN